MAAPPAIEAIVTTGSSAHGQNQQNLGSTTANPLWEQPYGHAVGAATAPPGYGSRVTGYGQQPGQTRSSSSSTVSPTDGQPATEDGSVDLSRR